MMRFNITLITHDKLYILIHICEDKSVLALDKDILVLFGPLQFDTIVTHSQITKRVDIENNTLLSCH